MYKVKKRDNKLVEFDLGKINQAITLAFEAQGRDFNPSMIDFLALKVTADFEPKIKDHSIAVEDIQDSVENVLVQAGYSDVAKAYKENADHIIYLLIMWNAGFIEDENHLF